MVASSTEPPGDPSPWIYKAEGDFRTAYAVEIRYPGENATVEESKQAVKLMRRARRTLRSKLGFAD